MAEGTVDTQTTSTDSGTSQSGTTQQSSQQTSQQGMTTQATSQPASKWEDDPRAKGLLSDLQKERRQRQEYERQKAEYETKLEERQRQIEALTGVRTPSKEEADIEQIRERLLQIFPALAKLSDEQLVDKITAMADQGEQFQQANQHYWTQHGSRMLDSVHKEIANEMGDLTDRQKKRINAAYVAEAEADPNFLARHDKGDPTLIKEFVKNYLEDFVEPVKRKVTASEAGRFRPVPGGRDRSVPMQGDKPIDVKDDKAVMDFIVKSRSGQFGRR